MLQSEDGLDWKLIKNRTGPIEDRSTFFFDSMRERWVFTNKVSGTGPGADGKEVEFGRSHAYFASQTHELCEWSSDGMCTEDSLTWTKMFSSDEESEPRPWVLADADDPRLLMPNGTAFDFNKGTKTANPNQLYNLDATGYESLLVGQFSVLQCKHGNYPAGCPGPESGHEFNSVFLGWSRDGFHWFRPPAPRSAFAPLDLTSCPAVPAGTMPYAFTNCTVWNYEDIQSVAGGWIVGQHDRLYTYVSGRALNMALDQTGLLTMRREHAAAIEARPGHPRDILVLIWRCLSLPCAHRRRLCKPRQHCHSYTLPHHGRWLVEHFRAHPSGELGPTASFSLRQLQWHRYGLSLSLTPSVSVSMSLTVTVTVTVIVTVTVTVAL